MATVAHIPGTYSQAVRTLARWHGEDAAADLEIFEFPDPEQQAVRLLEVSEAFPTTGQATAFAMGRSEEFPFKSAVVLVTTDEWRRIQRGELRLPEGWNLQEMRKVWPNE